MLINWSYGSVMQNMVLLSAKYRFFLLSYLTNEKYLLFIDIFVLSITIAI